VAIVAPQARTAANADFQPIGEMRLRSEASPNPSASRLPSCPQIIVSSSSNYSSSAVFVFVCSVKRGCALPLEL
jgi:hypothetical protein